MTIAIDHRPPTLDKMIGNEKTIKTVSALLERRSKFPHAIEITGPTGCGKTTLGRIISTELGAMPEDYKEIDTSDFRGIETIRELRKTMRLGKRNPESTCRVILMDECHGLTKDAQNALLKALEDAPGHVYFILCTTDPQKMIATLRGRCTALTVSPLSDSEMESLLRRVMRAEKIRVPSDVRELIIEQSNGHPRNALQMLGKIIGLDPEEMAEFVEEEAAQQTAAIDLCRAIMDKKKWATVAKILNGLKTEDEEKLRRMVLGYCNKVLLGGNNIQAFIVMEEFESPFYNTGKPGLTLACYRAVVNIN